MSVFRFEPVREPALPIEGCEQSFPVRRVFCLGRNYHWGSGPQGDRQPPLYFMKPASAVIEAVGEIAFPPLTEEFCPEIELVVALGRGGRNIAESAALEHVLGYAAGLDLTRRDLQRAAKAAGQSWEAAKAFDDSAPITSIVPVSRIGHPQQGAIRLSVNGEVRQQGDLARQIWSVAEAIALLSRYQTLQPGDLIMTGTPDGVAPVQPGDRISAVIEGIARLDVRIGAKPSLLEKSA